MDEEEQGAMKTGLISSLKEQKEPQKAAREGYEQGPETSGLPSL